MPDWQRSAEILRKHIVEEEEHQSAVVALNRAADVLENYANQLEEIVNLPPEIDHIKCVKEVVELKNEILTLKTALKATQEQARGRLVDKSSYYDSYAQKWIIEYRYQIVVDDKTYKDPYYDHPPLGTM